MADLLLDFIKNAAAQSAPSTKSPISEYFKYLFILIGVYLYSGLLFVFYSSLNASIGFMLTARCAGIRPINVPNITMINRAPII